MLYERSLKAMMDQFLALTMHNVYESNERINQIMAGKQGAVLEFQFDQESDLFLNVSLNYLCIIFHHQITYHF